MSANLEELAEQIVKVAWSQFTSEIATCYAENTSGEDDTPERWAQLRTIAFQRMADKVTSEQARREAVAPAADPIAELASRLPRGEWGPDELGTLANWLTKHGYDIGGES